MSAGGAMASVLAATHPDVFAAVAVHSGLAYGCARTLPSAMQAMRQGGPDPEAQGRAAHAAMGAAARVVPALVVHGTADQVVCPVNGEHAVRQWLATNRLAGGDGADVARPDAVVRDDAAGRLPLTRRTWTDGAGRALVEHVEIEGLGHAWSGGAAGGSYTDPRGPSASAAIWDFFARVSA
jgi:poly(3-hydroxybutyrate) depolymerase